MSDSGQPEKPEKPDKPEVEQDHEKIDVNKLKDGAMLSNRSCTDCLMIVIFLIFCIGWVIVLTVALQNGKPSRLLLPENFRGELCGDTDDPLEDWPYLYIPKPSRISYGLCTQYCPNVMDYVCNNDEEGMISNKSIIVRNHHYSHTFLQYQRGMALIGSCSLGLCNGTELEDRDRMMGLLQKVKEYKCFFVFYSSSSTLKRCLPFSDNRDNASLAELAGESSEAVSALSEKLGVGAFFRRGFSETENSWVVILICCFTCMVISMIWVFLLRWILAPIVYLCILLIFAILIAIGYLAKLMADDLENVTLPGDTGTEDQVKMWRAIEYAAFLCAAIYFVVMLWMLKRIKIAIAIMKEASKAFLNNPGMVIIPPVILVLLIGWVAFFIVMTVYIQTIGSVQAEDFKTAAVSAFGEDAVNLTLAAANATSDALESYNSSLSNYSVNTSAWETEDVVKALHAYNFFGFLWASNFCIMFGFFIMAFATSVWYYSATTLEIDLYENGDEENGRMKGTAVGTLFKCFCAALRYHLGTILWGSLLIAIIQFVRAVMLYIEEEFLNEYKDNATIKIVIYCINCWLACIERVIRIISKNAFIITIIRNTSFCASAIEAMSLLVNNVVRTGALTMMSTIACFVIKLFIVGCNMVVAYFLINMEALTQGEEIESGLFPLIGIFIISFIIASLFINVYESCVDTIMMCFFVDEKHMDGVFMPPSLSKLVDKFTAVEAARKKYENQLKEATRSQKADVEPSSKS